MSVIPILTLPLRSLTRRPPKRYVVVFDKGVKVELFSATEISKSGLTRNLSEYPEDFDSSRQEPIFALGADNFIIEYHIATGKH